MSPHCVPADLSLDKNFKFRKLEFYDLVCVKGKDLSSKKLEQIVLLLVVSLS